MNKINKYIYINSKLILNLIYDIINLSNQNKKKNKCPICNKKFDFEYIYIKEDINLIIYEHQIHLFEKHNIIDSIFYKKICNNFIPKKNLNRTNKSKYNYNNDNMIIDDNNNDILNTNISWCLLNTNGLNIIDGLYEIGSNQIYIEKNKNLSESKISRFSEHSGFIYFEKNKISNISVITNSRVDLSDPLIYMPGNCLEALKVNYIYHTHPKTPYIGSRIKLGIIYEFPSISDIIHFIEHHNNGKLLGSIVLAPEGIYIIRKNNFDRNLINVDYDIMISELEEIFMQCYNDSYYKYSNINYKDLKINNEIKLPDDYFYDKISTNYEYINKINTVLEKYDLFIDYYARVLFNKSTIYTKKWIFDDIYIPFIN